MAQNAPEYSIVPATKKEILFARLNTYEIVPYIKKVNNEFFPFHNVDINFKLNNNEKSGGSEFLTDQTELLSYGDKQIRTMSVEKFLLFLCIHLYREATMIFKIVAGGDLTLYKFMDIHFFVSKNEINWNKVYDYAQKLNILDAVYYSLFYVEELYPKTIEENIIKLFTVPDITFLDKYKGKDNSEEEYFWKIPFHERIFNCARKKEAMVNIEKESKRYEEIVNRLKN